MGKIFVVMGKTSSGKDTIYKKVSGSLLATEGEDAPKSVVIYTTRPMRPGETNGVEYFFSTEEKLKELREQGRVIEERCFHTVHGLWYYFTVNDGQIDLEHHSYLMINTLDGFEMIRSYYKRYKNAEIGMSEERQTEAERLMKPETAAEKEETVIPIYIEADSKERLLRYINRESLQEKPNYKEVCRRFLADETDFAEEKLKRLGIEKYYVNQNLEACCAEIEKDIRAYLKQDVSVGKNPELLERGLPYGKQL